MSKQILDNLFNSKVRVRVLRFFFRNDQSDFDILTLARRVQEPYWATRREVNFLVKLGVLRKRK